MNQEENYIRDIAEIRAMMERSSRFLTLSGWAGICAGIYALVASYIAATQLNFHPDSSIFPPELRRQWDAVLLLAIATLLLALTTAIFFSYRKARSRGEKVWTATLRRLLEQIAVPLVAGGVVLGALWSKGLVGWIAPLTLVFYGLALYSAGKFTYLEVKLMGLIQLLLGLVACFYIENALYFWAIGFGFVHILYGIYMYFKYDR